VEEEIVAGGLHRLEAGLEKNPGLKKKQPSGVFLFFFWFFWFIGVFFGGVFLYICPEERVFRVFSVSRILLGAYYNHSYSLTSFT
jgi:hypothetical protein